MSLAIYDRDNELIILFLSPPSNVKDPRSLYGLLVEIAPSVFHPRSFDVPVVEEEDDPSSPKTTREAKRGSAAMCGVLVVVDN